MNEKKQHTEDRVSFEVRETTRDTKKEAPFLRDVWCECPDGGEFLCYPEDGCCTCGIHKHHVHCAKCGGVMQIG